MGVDDGAFLLEVLDKYTQLPDAMLARMILDPVGCYEAVGLYDPTQNMQEVTVAAARLVLHGRTVRKQQ